jgi:hypothetical protein
MIMDKNRKRTWFTWNGPVKMGLLVTHMDTALPLGILSTNIRTSVTDH